MIEWVTWQISLLISQALKRISSEAILLQSATNSFTFVQNHADENHCHLPTFIQFSFPISTFNGLCDVIWNQANPFLYFIVPPNSSSVVENEKRKAFQSIPFHSIVEWRRENKKQKSICQAHSCISKKYFSSLLVSSEMKKFQTFKNCNYNYLMRHPCLTFNVWKLLVGGLFSKQKTNSIVMNENWPKETLQRMNVENLWIRCSENLNFWLLGGQNKSQPQI